MGEYGEEKHRRSDEVISVDVALNELNQTELSKSTQSWARVPPRKFAALAWSDYASVVLRFSRGLPCRIFACFCAKTRAAQDRGYLTARARNSGNAAVCSRQ